MLQSVFGEESLCCSLGENKCTNALVKSSHGKKNPKNCGCFWIKKSVFFATVPQCQGLFFCASRQTSLFICQRWQDNDYCLVCRGAICIVSDNRLSGERGTKKQKGPKSQDNDTDISKRSITGCVHLKQWGIGGLLLTHLFWKDGCFNFLSGLLFFSKIFFFFAISNILIIIWFGLSPWHDINM